MHKVRGKFLSLKSSLISSAGVTFTVRGTPSNIFLRLNGNRMAVIFIFHHTDNHKSSKANIYMIIAPQRAKLSNSN